jgi:hypothetical protein
MPDNGTYSDSAPARNREDSQTWKSIGELARRLAEKAAKEAGDGR